MAYSSAHNNRNAAVATHLRQNWDDLLYHTTLEDWVSNSDRTIPYVQWRLKEIEDTIAKIVEPPQPLVHQLTPREHLYSNLLGKWGKFMHQKYTLTFTITQGVLTPVDPSELIYNLCAQVIDEELGAVFYSNIPYGTLSVSCCKDETAKAGVQLYISRTLTTEHVI